MTRPARLAAFVFAVVSALYLLTSLGFPLGTPARPGPGFFPVGVGAFLCVVAVIFVITSLRATAPATPSGTLEADPAPGGLARVAVVAASLVGFVALLPWVGYAVVAFLFVAILLRRLGGSGWPLACVIAAGAAAVSYWLFAVLLAVPLPRGYLLD